MRAGKTVCLLLLSLILGSGMLHSQSGKIRRHARIADNFFTFNKYDKALDQYLILLQLDSSNFDYNYRTGICYANLPEHKEKSVTYFLRASYLPVKDTIPDLYYYLGVACQRINRFDEALNSFYTLQRLVADQGLLDIDQRIAACKLGKEMLLHPTDFEVLNLGENVNSSFPDYAPVLSEDESVLIFTSKRNGSTGGRKTEDGYYYEDVYISHRQDQVEDDWRQSSRVDSTFKPVRFFRQLFTRAEGITQINTNDHDACISITPDGKKLYLLRGSIVYSSLFTNGKWAKPQRVENFSKNRNDLEPSLTLSTDGKTLFVVSDRKGGFGGKDIYKTTLQPDGSWGQLENLGSNINTDLDEESPFIQSDTLYFSSQGHQSVGGYDVFKSVFQNGAWTLPVNMGAPINTGGDDLFFVVNKKGDRGYYASEGSPTLGDLDIFVVDFPEINPHIKLNVVAFGNDPAKRIPAIAKLTGVSGKADTTAELGLSGRSNFTLLPDATVNLEISAEGYLKHPISFQLPKVKRSCNLLVEAEMTPLKNSSGKIIGRKSTFYVIRTALKRRQLSDSALALKGDRKLYWQKALGTTDTAKIWTLTFTDYFDSVRIKPVDTTVVLASTVHQQILDSVRNAQLATTTTSSRTDTAHTPEFHCQPIIFDFSGAGIRKDAVTELNRIAAYLKAHPESKLQIKGYTDSKGSDKYNLTLSQHRANAARHYFVWKGVNTKRLVATGYGKASPVSPNELPDGSDNSAGRQLNRRVEFILLNQ
jgi:outer membrane protein OmpA-like peptidoglycan-associated protein